ncbi:MAG: DNA ligase [Desulfobulbus sp.]|nr:MAG: DNA ligase [Desulfobulbus sp.]
MSFLLILFLSCLPPSAQGREIMLAREYADDMAVQGWLMSEKLDGVRGYWTGSKMLSKNGHILKVPSFFSENFPPFALEGELWGGRGTFAGTVSIIKRERDQEGWRKLQFAIFDVPEAAGGFSDRLQQAKEWFTAHPSLFAFVIPQVRIESRAQLYKKLKQVEAEGGEGLIVRKADGLYVHGRSSEICKLKSSYDTEAVIVGYRPGAGRNSGRLGALVVELQNNRDIRFKIGTGFTDLQRENPPAIGTIITFKYYGFYPSGIPRFPSFLRVREDAGL